MKCFYSVMLTQRNTFQYKFIPCRDNVSYRLNSVKQNSNWRVSHFIFCQLAPVEGSNEGSQQGLIFKLKSNQPYHLCQFGRKSPENVM